MKENVGTPVRVGLWLAKSGPSGERPTNAGEPVKDNGRGRGAWRGGARGGEAWTDGGGQGGGAEEGGHRRAAGGGRRAARRRRVARGTRPSVRVRGGGGGVKF